ncbi:MAG TPA: serine protease [bacterium]|nr:serine protease [bacterium]
MRRAAVAVLAVVLLLEPGIHSARGAAGPPNRAVFQIVTLLTSSGAAVSEGTAFFTAANGTALTNSHVVHFARTDPAHYQLIALYGREFYSAAVVCANTLPAPPMPDGKPAKMVPGRDVAQIRLEPSRLPGANVLHFQDGPEFTAHISRLPEFPVLRLGSDPSPGMEIRVTGYGLIQERLKLTPWEQWTTRGVIKDVGKAPDGTPVFIISSIDSPRPGNSGSPVLDEADVVVGIIAWASNVDFSFSAGIGSSALKEPCGP